MRVLPYGEPALLIEVTGHLEALAVYEDIRRAPPAGLVDLVPAAATVLAVFADAEHAAAAYPVLRRRSLPAVDRGPVGELVEIPAVYDGADLNAVAASLGMSVEEVVRRHEACEYRVAFIGFAPGFAYLTGLDPLLRLPRRSEPRTRVPAGSVAMAGEFTAVYPRQSPGGWHLLGHTPLRMWDLERRPPALLRPGMRVRFRQVPPLPEQVSP